MVPFAPVGDEFHAIDIVCAAKWKRGTHSR
jgi:hypothetical protein